MIRFVSALFEPFFITPRKLAWIQVWAWA